MSSSVPSSRTTALGRSEETKSWERRLPLSMLRSARMAYSRSTAKVSAAAAMLLLDCDSLGLFASGLHKLRTCASPPCSRARSCAAVDWYVTLPMRRTSDDLKWPGAARNGGDDSAVSVGIRESLASNNPGGGNVSGDWTAATSKAYLWLTPRMARSDLDLLQSQTRRCRGPVREG